MANHLKMSSTEAKVLVQRFATLAGTMGLLVGTVYMGQHIHQWKLLSCIVVPLGFGAISALVGAFFGFLVIALTDTSAESSSVEAPNSMGQFRGMGDIGGAPYLSGEDGQCAGSYTYGNNQNDCV